MEDNLVTPSDEPSLDTSLGMTVVAEAHRCLAAFDLCLGIDDVANDSDLLEQIGIQANRFRLWAGNLGVFASGHASLDYRLRVAPEAAEELRRALAALRRCLERGEKSFALILKKEGRTNNIC